MRSNEPPTAQPPGLVNGRLVLLVALLLVLTIPPASLGLWWIVATRAQHAQAAAGMGLDWSQRDAWRPLPARRVSLSAAGFLTPPGNAGYRDLRFHPPRSERELVRQLTDRARSTATNPTTGPAEPPHAAAGHFYAAFLRGDLARAFRRAPAALVLRFQDPQGRPVPDLPLPPLELVFAITTPGPAGELDESLRLIFPDLHTDDAGRVILPAYRTAFRLVEPATQPPGHAVTWGLQDWHEFPGPVGSADPFPTRSASNR